jgi:hypothetical protein
MLIQFLVGGIVSVCNITIHALVMTVVVRVARPLSTKKKMPPVAAPDRHYDCNSFGLDGRACS